MKPNKLTVASAALMLVFGAASAQEAGFVGPATHAAAGQGMMCRAYERIDGQLAYIKAELKITEAQEPQWSVFMNMFRADKEKQARACKAAQEQSRQMISASLPESMKIKVERLAEQLQSLRALEAAVQPLYSILSKDQKKTADEIMKGAP